MADILDKKQFNVIKPLLDLITKQSPNNVVQGYVAEILEDANKDIIGYKVKIGSEDFKIYDTTHTAQVRDLVTVSVTQTGGLKLGNILNTVPHRVDITTISLGINDG
jgi:hypothetical protein